MKSIELENATRKIDNEIAVIKQRLDALQLLYDPDFLESVRANAARIVQQGSPVPGKPILLEISLHELPVSLLITIKEPNS